MRAVSGGGRGSTKKKPDTSLASYSPYQKTDKGKGTRGGTIPPGYYKVGKPSEYSGSMKGPPISKLTPIDVSDPFSDTGNSDTPYGRDFNDAPFLIHGRGPEGSDGCIVIDGAHRKPLLDAVEASKDPITLRVSLDESEGNVLSPHIGANFIG